MQKIRSIAFRLARANEGVAMVEFAFVAPVLLLLILGGLEVANLALSHLRINQIAVSVADNAGRVNIGIDEANIYEVFAGADVLGRSIDFEENGRVILSSLEHNGRNGSNEGQTITWQRCWGDLDVDPAYGEEGDGANDSSLAGGLGAQNPIVSTNNTAVMFVEVTYDYQPLVGPGWLSVDQIRSEAAYNVRSRQNNNLSNAQSLVELDCD